MSSYASMVNKGVRMLPSKMVTHNWGNLFDHLVAAVLADALNEPSYAMVSKLLGSDLPILKGTSDCRSEQKM